jgi:hypothetical protein
MAMGVPSYVWQINMRTATAPSVITATPMGGNTCFFADPVIDPQGTGIVYFSDSDTNNVRGRTALPQEPSQDHTSPHVHALSLSSQVIGVDTEGKWNSDRLLALPLYSKWATVDASRKQGFV